MNDISRDQMRRALMQPGERIRTKERGHTHHRGFQPYKPLTSEDIAKKVQDGNKFSSENLARKVLGKGYYWYVFGAGYNERGEFKEVLLGPFTTEVAANDIKRDEERKGEDVELELWKTQTKNNTDATREWKAEVRRKRSTLINSVSRVSHKGFDER